MSVRERRSPKGNVDAVEFITWLDSFSSHDDDVDGKQRLYINNVHPDEVVKRELRRYRHGQVLSIRTVTAERIATYFNLNLRDMNQHGR